MKGTKIGVLFLIAIMSVAGVGASYAAWSQSVDIQGSVTTGTFDFRIYSIDVNEANGAIITPYYIDTHTFGVTVTDTYPGWKGFITVKNQNAGTVSLKFNTFQILSLAAEDWTMLNAYTLKFYQDDYAHVNDHPANVAGTLYDFQTLQYYDWYLTPYEIKMAPGTYHDSLVSLELDPALTGHYGSTVTFIFELTAIQTTP
jgi:predicted ribosomally synthesized peptide with SipW-like signal peptide